MKNLFYLQIIRVIFLFLISFLISLIVSSLVIRFLKKINFGKHIKTEKPIFYEHHKKKEGTITSGGLGFIFTTIFLTLIFHFLGQYFNGFFSFLDFFKRNEVYLPFLVILVSSIIGFLDDLLGVLKIGNQGGIGWKEKFLVYLALGIFVTWWFYVKLSRDNVYLPLFGYFDLGAFYIFFTLFVILGSLHGANLTDGLDGLLIGVSLSIFLPLILISFLSNYFHLASFLAVFLGSLIGFSWFNFYPAKAFMGDVGSVTIGVLIGTVATILNLQFYLLFFAFIFVIEALSVIIQVFSKKIFKKKIFLSAPLHHHFQALGWQEPNITFRFSLINFVFSSLGLILYFISKML